MVRNLTIVQPDGTIHHADLERRQRFGHRLLLLMLKRWANSSEIEQIVRYSTREEGSDEAVEKKIVRIIPYGGLLKWTKKLMKMITFLVLTRREDIICLGIIL